MISQKFYDQILRRENRFLIITSDECKHLQATKEFIEAVNKCRAGRRAGPVSWSTAVKFLTARKFEVARALALYEQHEATRRREGLALLYPTQEPLLTELRTGKFTVLVSSFFFLINENANGLVALMKLAV